MKKSELKQLIKEEISKILKEDKTQLKEFDAVSYYLGRVSASNTGGGQVTSTELMITGGILAAILGTGIYFWAKENGYQNPISAIKGWWENKKKKAEIRKIVDRLKNDSEVLDAVNKPNKKGFWQIIDKKLLDNEKKYLKSITRSSFKENNEAADNTDISKLDDLLTQLGKEINNTNNEGRQPGPKEQRRREIYALANKYLSKNHTKVQSYSFDENTDTFHFYKGDWENKNERPVISISFNDLKNKL